MTCDGVASAVLAAAGWSVLLGRALEAEVLLRVIR